MGDKSAKSLIRFHRDNRRWKPSHYTTNWLGVAEDGVVVIPSQELNHTIERRGLEGLLLPVNLNGNGNNGHTHYFAYSQKGMQPEKETPWQKMPTALLIDGQNFAGSLEDMELCRTGHKRPMPLLERVQKIYESIPRCALAQMFFCTESNYQGNYYRREIERIKKWGKIEIIDREPKFIKTANGHRRKKEVDIDAIMLPHIPYIRIAHPHIRGLVVVTGDSDYEHALMMWAGLGRYNSTDKNLLRIIGDPNHMGRELLRLGNHHHVKVTDIRHY